MSTKQPAAEAPADTKPSAATVANYASMGPEELAAAGPDLPDTPTLMADVDTPERNRWGVRALPAKLLPLGIVRALWRWDRATDLARDLENLAAELTGDTELDAVAADADLALVLAGTPAHHAADLAHRRDSTTRAAADLRQRATLVGEAAQVVCAFDTEADPNRPTLPALLPHLRGIVGPRVAAYLADLERLATERDAIRADMERVSDWWRRVARPDYTTRRPALVADAVAIPADQVSVTYDGVRNPTRVAVPFAALVDVERANLAPLAAPTP